MLRYFAKSELENKEWSGSDKILSNYHLKTLMLWTCEQESADWWSSTCVEICFKLLRTLSEWLSNKKCSNYFVSNCNLLGREMNEENLNETDSAIELF